jgi:HPt (histidine-containing phosphotransfer) domain-containing protein/HAMP domain-containing protein
LGWAKIRLGFGAKLALSTSLLVALAALLTGVFATWRSSELGLREAERRASSFASNVAPGAATAILEGSDRSIRSLAMRLGDMPGVRYGRVLDAEGRPLLAANRSAQFSPQPLLIDDPLRHGTPRIDRRIIDGTIWIELVVPVSPLLTGDAAQISGLPDGTRIPMAVGYLQLGLDSGTPESGPVALSNELLAFVGGVSLVGFVLALVLCARLTRPIRTLAASSRDIADGDFDLEIGRYAADEVGELAESLDLMLERLRDYRGQLSTQQDQFEHDVHERTLELKPQAYDADLPASQSLAAAEEPAEAIIDRRQLERIAELHSSRNPERLEHVVAVFMTSAPEQLSRARQALEQQDQSALVRALHTLKGSSAQVGARRLNQLCKNLEARARQGELGDMVDRLLTLDSEIESARELLAASDFGVVDE